MRDEFATPSKYRRTFDWRLSRADKGSRDNEIAALARLASSDYVDIFEDYLQISRLRKANPTAIAKVQLHLVEELLFVEQAVKHYKSKIKELEDATASENVSENLASDIKLAKRELFYYRAYSNLIRVIGDGVAWRALDFDRAVLRVLGEGATKHSVISDGLIQELREWSYQFDFGKGVAILNSLTNCLVIGDVTLVKPDDSIEIIEVKTSDVKSRRITRQKQKLREVVTLLNDGSIDADGRKVEVEIMDLIPSTWLDELSHLLRRASKDGWSAQRVSRSCYIECFDARALGEMAAVYKSMAAVREKRTSDWLRDDFVFDMMSLDILSYSPNCAPFSVYPFDSRTCIDLLTANKWFVSYLNLSQIAREFIERGWTVKGLAPELIPNGDRETALAVSKGGLTIHVPPAHMMRMQMELLKPSVVIDECESRFRQGPGGSSGLALTIYAGESKLWR
jgi:hypothetical protein